MLKKRLGNASRVPLVATLVAIVDLGIIISAISGVLGPVNLATVKGRIVAKPRHFHRAHQLPADPETCACKAFTYCDALYQIMSDEDRARWRDALKRPHTSAYDLWMGECLTLLNAGLAPPDDPSPSGGFTSREAQPGETYPGLEVCGWTPPPPRWHCTGPPDYICIPDPEGEYETEEECLEACVPPPPEPWPPGFECPWCAEDTPSKATTIIAGLTGPAAAWNGTYIVPQNIWDPCNYVILGPPLYVSVDRYDINHCKVHISPDFGETVCEWERFDAPADCYPPTVLPWIGGTGDFAGQTESTATVSGYQP